MANSGEKGSASKPVRRVASKRAPRKARPQPLQPTASSAQPPQTQAGQPESARSQPSQPQGAAAADAKSLLLFRVAIGLCLVAQFLPCFDHSASGYLTHATDTNVYTQMNQITGGTTTGFEEKKGAVILPLAALALRYVLGGASKPWMPKHGHWVAFAALAWCGWGSLSLLGGKIGTASIAIALFAALARRDALRQEGPPHA